MNSFSCVITGHRPTRFKFKYNEKDKRCQRIKKCLQEQLIRLYHQGVRCFWVGGAMGVDMWAAELLLRMKEQQAYGKSQKSLNFLCFCGYYNRQMSAKYYNGQILKNIFLYNYIAG